MTVDIFSPLYLKNITLPNRLVRAATYEGMADTDGVPGPAVAKVPHTRLQKRLDVIERMPPDKEKECLVQDA